MTTIGDIIFILVWFGALICGIFLMSNGWSLMWSKPKPYDPEEGPKKIHPELEGVEDGEELLVVDFGEPEPIDKDRFKLDSPALHGEDPLHKSLQDRINELNEDEDDDDDDGDIIVRI